MTLNAALIAREGTDFQRDCSEFNATVSDWEARLARIDGDVLGERDFPVYDDTADEGLPTDEDWGWFREQVFAD